MVCTYKQTKYKNYIGVKMKKISNLKFFVLLILSIMSLCMISCGRNQNVIPTTCAMVMEKSSTTSELTDETAEQVFSQIEEVISQREDLRIIDRTRFESVKEELAFQQSDLSNKQKTAEIGKALNADLICFVTIYKAAYKVEFLNVNTVQKITYNGRFGLGWISKNIKTKDLRGLRKLNVNKIIEGEKES